MKSVGVNLSNELGRVNGYLDKLQQMIKYAIESHDQTVLNILSSAYMQISDYSKLTAFMLNTELPEEKWNELQELRTNLDSNNSCAMRVSMMIELEHRLQERIKSRNLES